jgi:phenylalanyl-tRNA synthetase beta subunit
MDFPVMKPYDLSRSALVGVAGTDIVLGSVGEFRAEVRSALKLPAFIAGFEIGPLQLQKAVSLSAAAYEPLAKYPRTSQDISLRVESTMSYEKVFKVLEEGLAEISQHDGHSWELEPVDIYQKAEDSKHITLRVTLWNVDRTLTTEEVTTIISNVLAKKAKTILKAERL